MGTRASAIGAYVPDRALTNRDLEEIVDTSDDWIVQRTGIRERRIAAPHEYCSDLSVAALLDSSSRAGVSLKDIDFLIVSTSTPDEVLPSVASQVQYRTGLANAGALDINAACAGFVYGLIVADALLQSGMYRKIAVIGSEVLSRFVDYTDRGTCILFGDGAGAVIVESSADNDGVVAQCMGSDGEGGRHLYIHGSARRFGEGDDAFFIRQNGREVFKWAVATVSAGVSAMLDGAGLAPEDIDWFVPHSANMRITEAIAQRVGIRPARILQSNEFFGNTSSASIPLALASAAASGSLHRGQRLLLYGFGAGLVHAGVIWEW